MEERVSRGRFIRLGAALGAAGASVLVACGGGDDSGGDRAGGGSDGNGSGGRSTEAAASGEHPIASASEVEAGSAAKFKDAGNPAVLVHLENGGFVAYSAVCTHQQCTVDYRGGQLACPCHGSIFDPANGAEVVSGPAQRPLPEIPVEVRGGEVYKA
ncbi:MAG TPA: Rieske (2Fe-2S) protein [Rubrobacteraceae bacterium]|nr:Rieske (2Fe-2S) protein [Rubrobacteraceae bacterium]